LHSAVYDVVQIVHYHLRISAYRTACPLLSLIKMYRWIGSHGTPWHPLATRIYLGTEFNWPVQFSSTTSTHAFTFCEVDQERWNLAVFSVTFLQFTGKRIL